MALIQKLCIISYFAEPLLSKLIIYDMQKVPMNISLSALTPMAMEKSHSSSLDPPQACTDRVI